jgi:2-polyprenyl-3-methyl-5-hydroxy-6-metoxy-1,4-benzoquinol methylase
MLLDRTQRIRALCAGKRVLDVGCLAHGQLSGRNNSGFLHADIRSVAAEVVGLDNDAAACRLAREAGYSVVCGNAEALDPAQLGKFDVVVAGELIEHLSNPGLFLDGARAVLSDSGTLIVTVPNAWSFSRLKQLRKGIDDEKWTHSEHTCWYSKATIVALLRRHRFEVAEVGFCTLTPSERPLKRLGEWLRLGWAMRKEFAESVMVVAQRAP